MQTHSITQRLDAATLVPAELRTPILPPPKSGKLELAGDCNLGCAYCSRTISNNTGEMDRALYSRIIREMVDLGIRSVGLFFIGESFLLRDLPQRIEEARALGMDYVFLTTNGTIATPARVRECMAAGLSSLKFSLNYADVAQFEEIARKPGVLFERTLSNLRAARRIRDEGSYDCGIYASSILYDGVQRTRMQALVDSIADDVDEHYFLPCFSMQGAADNAGFLRSAGNPGRVGALRDPLPCWSLWSYHIDHLGRMIACCFGNGANDDFVMGDLRTQSFLEAWNSERFQALRAAHLAGDVGGTACANCAALG